MLDKKLMLEGEVFKDVPRYAGLISASNKGRIYSHERTVEKTGGVKNSKMTQVYKGRLLSQYDKSGGYMAVRFGADKKKYSELVSRLVLMAFVGEPKDGEFACHNDSNTTNNCIENLRWGDQKENMKDRLARNLYQHGKDHHNAKVPVFLVELLQSKAISPKDASKKYGLPYKNLWRIATGKTWSKHQSTT